MSTPTACDAGDLARRLQIGKSLGSGAYAVVHRARFDGQSVALKVLLPQYKPSDRDDCPAKMFLREGEMLCRVDHSHVIRCHGMLHLPPDFPGLLRGYTAPAPALVLELLEGGSLAALMHRQLMAPWKLLYDNTVALEWGTQLAGALAALHGCSPPIMHRDIKLDNVMMVGPSEGSIRGGKASRGGAVKLVDLGLATSPLAVMDDTLETLLRAPLDRASSQQQERGRGATNSLLIRVSDADRADASEAYTGVSQPGTPMAASTSGAAVTAAAAVTFPRGSSPVERSSPVFYAVHNGGAAAYEVDVSTPKRGAGRRLRPLTGYGPQLRQVRLLALQHQALAQRHAQSCRSTPYGLLHRPSPGAAGSRRISASASATGWPVSGRSGSRSLEEEGEEATRPRRGTTAGTSSSVGLAGDDDASSLGADSVTGNSASLMFRPSDCGTVAIQDGQGGGGGGFVVASYGGPSPSEPNAVRARAGEAGGQQAVSSPERCEEPHAAAVRGTGEEHAEAAAAGVEAEVVYDLTRETGSCMTMAPEVRLAQPYNEKADVFAFGMLLYQIWARSMLAVTHIGTRRPDLPRMVHSCEDWPNVIVDGYRPARLAVIPEPMWDLITECWDADPLRRPAMAAVEARLRRMAADPEQAEAVTGLASGKGGRRPAAGSEPGGVARTSVARSSVARSSVEFTMAENQAPACACTIC